jgi:large subunit ribosomal protein L21
MFAVIKAGGKQYRVVAEDVIRIDRVAVEAGQVIEFGEVLLLGGDKPSVGVPTVAGAMVAGEVLQHTRGDKVIAFKKRRRKNSRRKRGFRHDFSVIRITEILTDGAKPQATPPARPKKEPRAKVEGEATEAKPAKKAAKPRVKADAKTGGKSGAKPAAKAKKK